MVEAAVLSDGGRPGAGAVADARPARPLRLLALVSKAKGLSPGQRFRLEQWAPRLEANHRIRLDFVPFESPRLTELLYKPGHKPEKAAWVLWDFARRAVDVFRARDYDGVVVFREAALIGPAFYERLLSWRRVPMFFDFDDAIWMPTQVSAANGIFSKLHSYRKTATICRLSSAVSAGNEFLAAYARRQGANVFVVPTSIELEKYPLQPELSNDEPFVVGWSGSVHTLTNFEHAREPLERLARRRRVVVKVICNKPPARPIAGAENVFVEWREEGEAEEIGRVHVGIMPLQDEEYMRGKCGLKALQFMATGRPVVLSPVGMNRDLVRHGENGFLASSADDWVESLEKLAAEPELRRRIGAAGRATVEAGYSAENVAARFAEAVRSVLG